MESSDYKIFINKLLWKLNPFKKEIIPTLDISHFDKVLERFQRMHPESWKIDRSKIEIQPLDWYFDAGNIPNQNMIHDVYEYFETGSRKGFFDPLKAVGIFHIFYSLFIRALANMPDWLYFLSKLDFSEEEKHVLIGIILFWHGGYPIRNRFTGQHLSALRIVEKEFLKYNGATPEKKICRAKPLQKDGRWFEEKKILDCAVTELIEVPAPIIDTDGEPDSGNRKISKEPFPMSIVGKLHELCNGVQFKKVDSAVLFEAFNNPHLDMIKVCTGEKYRMQHLLHQAKMYLERNTHPKGHFESVCNAFGIKVSDCVRRKKLETDYRNKNHAFMKQVKAIFEDES